MITTEANFTYKPHLDGIRAIAIVSVILFHLFPTVFYGGYLGVDLFFVISGFVITQSLLKHYLQTNSISILKFYNNRFKRLYPALLTMLLITLTGFNLLDNLPDKLFSIALNSAIFTILGVSNFYIISNGNIYPYGEYINPFIHTWSLGTEIQFYLVFPILFLTILNLCKKYKYNFLKLLNRVIFLFSVLSFIQFCFLYSESYGGYYFSHTRFWEMGTGSILYIILFYKKPKIHPHKNWFYLSLLLLPLLILRLLVINLYIETLCAVIISCILIIYGDINLPDKNNSKQPQRNLLQKFLTNPNIIHIGRISYSLYLWHYPVMFFCSLYLNSYYFYVISLILIFCFAELSYYYIENPLRYSLSRLRSAKTTIQ